MNVVPLVRTLEAVESGLQPGIAVAHATDTAWSTTSIKRDAIYDPWITRHFPPVSQISDSEILLAHINDMIVSSVEGIVDKGVNLRLTASIIAHFSRALSNEKLDDIVAWA